jgi:hypothetical protein
MMLKCALPVVIGIGLCVAFAGVAAAGPEPSDQIKQTAAKSSNGPFKAVIRLNLGEGVAKNAYLKLKSTSGEKEVIDLQQNLVLPAFRDRYFKSNGTEITGEVHSAGGHDLGVRPAHPKVLRVRIKQVSENLSDCILVHAIDDEGAHAIAQIFFNTNTC